MKLYIFKDKDYTIHYLTDEEWKKLIDNTSITWWKKRLIRGVTINKYVYIKDSAVIGRIRLIEHEIGHVLNNVHTWLPVTMNPTWLFRWFRWMPNA